MINVIGLDPSLTHTAGFHAWGTLDAPVLRGFVVMSKPREHEHPIARLRYLRDALAAELEACVADSEPGVLFIEGYAFGAKCNREALGEWGGIARLLAFERGWDVVVVPPTVLKLYVCGKGNAPKELMMLNVFKRWGYSASDNNDCDAHALMRLGVEWCSRGTPLERSKRATHALDKLEPWLT